jgi:hypothetical protein
MTSRQEKLDLARRIVRHVQHLKKLPRPEHSAVEEMTKRPIAELRAAVSRIERGLEPFDAELPADTSAASVTKFGRAVGVADAMVRRVIGVATSVAQSPAQVTETPRRRAIVKGTPFGRIIRRIPLPNGRERVLHATRGWREQRA